MTNEQKWSAGLTGSIKLGGANLAFHLIRVDEDGATLYGSGTAVADPWDRSRPPQDVLSVADDRGGRYELRPSSFSRGPNSAECQLRLTPAPPSSLRWLDIVGPEGGLVRAEVMRHLARASVSAVSPKPEESADERFSNLVLWILASLGESSQPSERRKEWVTLNLEGVRQGGLSDVQPGQPLLDKLDLLKLALDDPSRPEGLPAQWATMLEATGRSDGPRWTSSIGLNLPSIDGVTIALDSLVSEPKRWLLYMEATPGWWVRPTPNTKRYALQVSATDDQGGVYVERYHGGGRGANGDEFCLRFLPRLDPKARRLQVTYLGETEQATVTFDLPDDLIQ